jgi:hypothetical protein
MSGKTLTTRQRGLQRSFPNAIPRPALQIKQLSPIRHYFEAARPASPTAVGNGAVP